jgi:hypothetical protein
MGNAEQPHEAETYRPEVQEDISAEFAPADRVSRTLHDLQWIQFNWDVLQSGDCFCRQTNIRLYSDGLADFSAFTSTTSSGDVWLFRGIALLGVNGDELYRIGQFDGPRMELTAHDYFVFRDRQTNPLIYPQQLFPIIHSGHIYYHC